MTSASEPAVQPCISSELTDASLAALYEPQWIHSALQQQQQQQQQH